MTPVMTQYNEIKSRFTNCIIFFQLGDFFELFDEDAILISAKLGLTLTKRGNHPMSGVPVANIDFYLKKITQITKKPIAICSQIETPEEAKALGKSIVTRDVTKIITPGTYTDPLTQDHNFILAIIEKEDYFELCYCDLSTSEAFIEEVKRDLLISEIYKINPSEIILNKEINKNLDILVMFEDIINVFAINEAQNSALNLLKKYIENNKIKCDLSVIKQNSQMYMKFSTNTIRNLEILNSSTNNEKNCLFAKLNHTCTPEGNRILKYNIVRPLVDKKKIEERLDCVEYFINYINKFQVIKFPKGDLKKLLNMKDVNNIRKIGEIIKESYDLIKNLDNKPILLNSINFNLQQLSEEILLNIQENAEEIGSGLCFNNSIKVNDLQLQREAILQEMFNLPDLYNVNCKVKNNSLIGFFFEFSKIKNDTPEDFILKQGLATSSRYTNYKLIELETKLKTLETEIYEVEHVLFEKMKEKIQNHKHEINDLAKYIGYLDYFHCCSICAINNNYYRPEFVTTNTLDIKNGRHPIIEHNQETFVSNDLNFSELKTEILITGPNMGGKSTFLRQNALIILMAQIGMFVPGKVKSKIFNGIFVRIGSGDNITQNESTFMLEMNECSEILRLSSENSLIILDEVGRGTSTNDGMSICIAILEYIHDILKCFALISTHYHELSKCESYLSRFENNKVDIFINNEDIIYLYKIKKGIAEGSFGINVASKAKLPIEIINRSKEIFYKLNK